MGGGDFFPDFGPQKLDLYLGLQLGDPFWPKKCQMDHNLRVDHDCDLLIQWGLLGCGPHSA